METENILGLRHTNAFYEMQKTKSVWESMREDFMGCAIGESFVVPFKGGSHLAQIRNQVSKRGKEFNKNFITNTLNGGELQVTRVSEKVASSGRLWALIKDQFLNCPVGNSFNVQTGATYSENKLRVCVSTNSKKYNMKYSVQRLDDCYFRLIRLPLAESDPENHFPAWLAWRFDNTPKESYSVLELAEAFKAGVDTGAAK